MAKARGRRYRNGWQTTRNHTVFVQAANGGLYPVGEPFPNALYSGSPYMGAQTAEVLLHPRTAYGIPLFAEPWLFTKRDVFIMGFGIFAFLVIRALADATAYTLIN